MASQCEPPLPQEITFPPDWTARAMMLEAFSIFERATGSFKNSVRTLEASCSSAAMTDVKPILFVGSCGVGAGAGLLFSFLDIVNLRFQGIVFVSGLFYFLRRLAHLPPGPYKIYDDEYHSDERQIFEP